MENSLSFIEGINPWWADSGYKYKIRERKSYTQEILEDTRLIKILIGARRVGKTSILQSCINTLLNRVPSKNIIYLSADLPDMKAGGIKKTIEFIAEKRQLNIFKERLYIFIDEVQEIEDWQNDVKLLYDNTQITFYLTGSSSLLLKKETSKLTGRFILRNVLPLSFLEFKDFYPGKERKEKELFEKYLQIGGYPEYVLSQNPTYLQQAIESTLYRELLDHFGIRNPRLLSTLLKFLADKITTAVSANRIATDLGIDDKTAKFYLEYLESVYLIYPVYKYGQSHKITKSSIPKYYFNDTGILSLYGIRSRIGHLTENVVFLEMLRQSQGEISDIYYDVINTQEIDFKQGNKLFEVKSFAELDEERLNKYEMLDHDITIIVNSENKELKKLPYYQNLQYKSTLDYLTGK